MFTWYTAYHSARAVVGGGFILAPATNLGHVFCRCFGISRAVGLLWRPHHVAAVSTFSMVAALETHS